MCQRAWTLLFLLTTPTFSFLMELLNTELQKLSCWFQANKLSINVKKSNIILYLRPVKLDKSFT